MEENLGCGCLGFIIIIIVIAFALFNFFDPDTYNNRYDDGNTITIEDERHCRDLGGTEALCRD
ncbi:hypothetical protein MKY41_01670 [Sporosarcina sp. FSL W7-1349]|uniref:hypothetical protein n=1 Tax=Sporosarcina sp. FSL W7-1349 TaxID=2921561 RepID=UPI0030F8CA2E